MQPTKLNYINLNIELEYLSNFRDLCDFEKAFLLYLSCIFDRLLMKCMQRLYCKMLKPFNVSDEHLLINLLGTECLKFHYLE